MLNFENKFYCFTLYLCPWKTQEICLYQHLSIKQVVNRFTFQTQVFVWKFWLKGVCLTSTQDLFPEIITSKMKQYLLDFFLFPFLQFLTKHLIYKINTLLSLYDHQNCMTPMHDSMFFFLRLTKPQQRFNAVNIFCLSIILSLYYYSV